MNIVTTQPPPPGPESSTSPRPPPAARRLPLDWRLALAALALFGLALLPRLVGLEQHLTADDQDWMARAVGFSLNLQRGNLRGTYQSAHPGVPVLWLASLAIGPQRAAELGRAGARGLAELEKSPQYLPALFDARRALAVASAALTVALALLTWRLFGPLTGLLAGLLLAFEPFLVAHGRLFHTDPLLAQLMGVSVLAALCAFDAGPHPPPEEGGGEGSGSRRQLTQVAGRPHSSPLPEGEVTGTSPLPEGEVTGPDPGPRPERVGIFHFPAPRLLILSGLAAGLALLTKAPAIFLFAFVPLLALASAWRRTGRLDWPALRGAILLLLPWGLAAAAIYVLLWPALWIDPLRTLDRMVDAVRGVGESPRRWGNFFLGQAVPEDAGPLFYPVATLLRLSPVTLVGLVALAAFGGVEGRGDAEARGRGEAEDASAVLTSSMGLLGYVMLFAAMMTLSDKKLDRYLLPVYPILNILAALGLMLALRGWLSQILLRLPAAPSLRVPAPLALILATGLLQAALLATVQPYPLSFFNPLLGGLGTARQTVVVGWGEGLDQVADFLDRQPNAARVVAATLYHGPLHAQIRGTALPPWEWQRAEYFVDYVNMEQRQIGASLRRALVESGPPLFVARINGLQYAAVYRIPPELKARGDLSDGLRGASVPRP